MEDLLIKRVRAHPVLYSSKKQHNKDVLRKQAAWEEIAGELEMTVEETKDAWQKLRKRFWNATHRHLRNKGKRVWIYEKAMSFLLPYMDSVKKLQEVTAKSYPNNDECDDFTETEYGTNNSKIIRIKSERIATKRERNFCEIAETEANICNISETESETNICKITDVTGNTDEKEVTHDDDYDDACASPHLEALNKKDEVTEISFHESPLVLNENHSFKKTEYDGKQARELDETEMFYLSMARISKRLPPIVQAKIKLHLSNAIFQAQIDMLENAKT